MLRVCIASIQNVERSLLLLVVSASDIPLCTIQASHSKKNFLRTPKIGKFKDIFKDKIMTK